MEIQDFIATTARGPIGLDVLTSLAADRRAHGDDTIAAFTSQVEHRSRAAQAVLDAAQTAGRDTLLASEQRSYDAAIRERDSLLGLQRAVEARTTQVAYVPPTQIASTTETRELSPVLSREQRCADWLQQRGHFAYGNERGVESMSFGRVVRALALGNRSGLSALEQRALAEGTSPGGAYLVPEVLGASFIDRMRARMVVMQAGAQTVPMTSNTLHLARLGQPDTGSPAIQTASWKSENADIDETDLLLDRVTFTARTLPVLIKLSVELSEDSANVDEMIERELSRQLALELDRAALLGSGTPPEPTGLSTQAGVDISSLGTGWDFDSLVDMASIVASKNFQPNARIYNSSAAAALAKLRASPSGEYLRQPSYLDPVKEYVTNQIGFDGGSPDSTTVFCGDFSQLLIGIRSSFTLEVSRVAGDAFSKLQIAVRAYLRADVQLAHPEAFVVRTNVSTH